MKDKSIFVLVLSVAMLLSVIIAYDSSKTINDSTAVSTSASVFDEYEEDEEDDEFFDLDDEIPPCPEVNREKALSREEAIALIGTGYHGCRPNSSAELHELACAQEKCINCGFRTRNGSNSLCDYCRWMELYGEKE